MSIPTDLNLYVRHIAPLDPKKRQGFEQNCMQIHPGFLEGKQVEGKLYPSDKDF